MVWVVCAAALCRGQETPPLPGAEAYGEGLGLSSARFWASEASRREAGRSLFLYREPERAEAVAEGFVPRPEFGVSDGEEWVRVEVAAGTSLYGLGAVAGPLLRNGFRGAIPGMHGWVLAVDGEGRTTGIVVDAAGELEANLEGKVEFRGRAPLGVIVTSGETPVATLIALSNLTGRMEMPPRWSLSAQVWGGDGAPAGPGTSVWARAKPGQRLEPAAMGVRSGVVLRDAPPWSLAGVDPGMVMRGGVGPVSEAEELQWWNGAAALLKRNGYTGVQMGPISLAPAAGPEGAVGPGAPGLRDRMRAVRAGLAPDETGPRPFVEISGGPLGVQALGGSLVFGGDERGAIAGALSMALSGQPLTGIGPVCRESHETAVMGLVAMPLAAVPRELIGDARVAAGQAWRRQLSPAMYTLALHAFYLGEPILRPVWFADVRDRGLRGVEEAVLVGGDVMVVRAGREPPLKGWMALELEPRQAGMPGVYVRPGAIVPLAEAGQDPERALDALTLVVVPDEEGRASGMLYEDEGDGYGFFRSQCRRLGYRAELRDGAYLVRLSLFDGAWPMPERPLRVRVLTGEGELRGEGVERGTVRVPRK
jgi:hypothetical protein